MWYLLLVLVLAFSSAELAKFHKCCPDTNGLVIHSYNKENIFECISSDRVFQDYNISSHPLVIGENVLLTIGLPENCLRTVITDTFHDNISEQNNSCYDRIVLEINNGTIKNGTPRIVTLACADSMEDKGVVEDHTPVKINKFLKCCPPGKVYDQNLHLCRDQSNSSVSLLVKEFDKTSSIIYEMDIGITVCKSDEYTIEMSDQYFNLNVDGNVLRALRRDNGFQGVFYTGEWCIDQSENGGLVALGCSAECDNFGALCLRKCCPVGQHYERETCNRAKSHCVPTPSHEVYLNLSSMFERSSQYGVDLNGDVLAFRIGIQCPLGKYILDPKRDDYHVDERGKIVLNPELGGISDGYCIETFDLRNCGRSVQVHIPACFNEVKPLHNSFKWSFMVITTSCVFLLLTLVVYIWLPELRNLHGRTLICHVSSMLVAYMCLATVQYEHIKSPKACTLLAYGIYFGFVSAFVWLNVMCLDIWWTFGSVRSVQPLRKVSTERRRFIWYSIYAWTMAIGLTSVMLLLDMYPVSTLLDANMGEGRCWFASDQNSAKDWPHYIFFVIPMGVMFGVNFVLWVLTARHCHRVKAEVHRMQTGSSGDKVKRNFRIDRARYILTGKLFVVMGAGWVWEVASTIVQEPRWLWNTIDIINELQGFFIFAILVLKPKLYHLIRKKLGMEPSKVQKSGASTSRTSSTFLSRSVSSDEHARASLKPAKAKV